MITIYIPFGWGKKKMAKGNIKCPCKKCDGGKVDETLLNTIDIIEKALGKELYYTSGNRCVEHNKAVGGVADSPHLTKEDGFSKALDIAETSDAERYTLIKLCLDNGINRIGIDKGFLHIDVDKSKNANRIWVYPSK
jgi:hypothetical protein